MKRPVSIILMLAGLALIGGALAITVMNGMEENRAENEVKRVEEIFRSEILPSSDALTGIGETDGASETGETLETTQAPSERPAETQAETKVESQTESTAAPEGSAIVPGDSALTITTTQTVQIDGMSYIGILEIPAVGISVPVLEKCSAYALKFAPCLYYGSFLQNDAIISGHNYRAHFKRLGECETGDAVIIYRRFRHRIPLLGRENRADRRRRL